MHNLIHSPKLKYFFVLALLLLLGFSAYSNSFKNEFVYDDNSVIVKNVFIQHPRYLPRIFKSDVFPYAYEAPLYYRPVPVFTHALEYRLWKLDQRGYHFDNTLLHCFNGFLIFILINMLFGGFGLALLTSVLFVIHPIQTSCVNWIVCRDNLLFSFFGLLSIISYLAFLRKKEGYKLLLSLLFFSLSFLCKDIAVLFIPLLLLCLAKEKKVNRAHLRGLLPFVLIFIVYLLLRVFVIGASFQINKYGHLEYGFWLSCLNFFNIILRYLGLLIAPLDLHIGRLTPFLTSCQAPGAIFVMLVTAALSVFIAWSLKRGKEVFWFGALWFVISIVFVFKAMYIRVYYGALMSELWLYLPSAGVFLIAAYLLLKLANRRVLFISLTTGLCLVYIVLSVYNNRFWRNEFTLFGKTLRSCDFANDIRINLAYAYNESGDYVSAEKELLKALKQKPTANEYEALGDFYFTRQESRKALEMYTRALEFRANPVILNNIGAIYGLSGDDKRAFDYFTSALRLNGTLHLTYGNLGAYYLKNHRYKEAERCFLRASELNPARIDYFIKLGSIYVSRGSFAKAKKSLALALEINPDSAEALIDLGNIYSAEGGLNTAAYYWKRALSLDPDNKSLKDALVKAGLRATE
ncbi:MAG: tetratricopeptide repeat protein [Candidatus Omnitrophota bacterium]